MNDYRDHRRDSYGDRLALPAALIGSLFAIAFILYAIDVTPLRMLVPSP